MTLKAFAVPAMLALSAVAIAADPPRPVGTTRSDLQRHDLSAPGREVLQARVDFAPGSSFPRHKHPGEEIIYVIEGTLEYELPDKGWVTLKKGDVLFVPNGGVPCGPQPRHRAGRRTGHLRLGKGQAAHHLCAVTPGDAQ